MTVSRRNFLGLTSALVAVPRLDALEVQAAPAQAAPTSSGTLRPLAPSFPEHPPSLAREMVAVAHNNLPRVRELLERWPTLARAATDWGYGDWEDALGAASHVGRRDIAELLLTHGARPSIFSAAMLGQLDVVKAFITASPGIEATHGPHSITLYRHAVAGGAAAQAVADYLKTLPAADRRPAAQPISADELKSLSGTYAFGIDSGDRFVVATNGTTLSIARVGRSARQLVHVGDRAFHPAGATSVRVRFGDQAGTLAVSVYDPDLVVVAERVS